MRDQLLEGLPVTERRLDLAGVSTSLLEGGDGPPIVLLHGQGGFAEMWARVIPHLVESHRVVAPDLPGLGHSEVQTGRLDAPRVVAWLGDLIAQTCAEPPLIVGHSLGGTIAARFAIEHGDRVRRIVLVDSGSLGRFRPALPVLLALLRFSARPSPATLDPNNNLQSGATYVAIVTTGAKDLAGNSLDQNSSLSGNQSKSWTFKVG